MSFKVMGKGLVEMPEGSAAKHLRPTFRSPATKIVTLTETVASKVDLKGVP